MLVLALCLVLEVFDKIELCRCTKCRIHQTSEFGKQFTGKLMKTLSIWRRDSKIRRLGTMAWLHLMALSRTCSIQSRLSPLVTGHSLLYSDPPLLTLCRIKVDQTIFCKSTFRQPATRSSLPAQHVWPTGFLCGWFVGLKFLFRLSPSDRQFQTFTFARY